MKRFQWVMILMSAITIITAMSISCIKVEGLAPEPLGMDYVLKKSGTSSEVRIVRDENYLPHIIGSNDEDIYFALGFVMAQDRISQLDMLRHAAKGRLGEILGPTPSYHGVNLATIDALMRSFRYTEDARAGYAKMDPEHKRLLDAFTCGINRYVQEIGDDLPFEAITLGIRTEPWRPEDSFAIMSLFGLTMTIDQIFSEYFFDKLAYRIGPEKMKLFFPRYPDSAPIITARNGDNKYIETLKALDGILDKYTSHPIGSNNWAVGAARTESGKALLANDPHVPLANMPTFWYHCHLQGGSFDAMGMMFPGFPAFGAATNGKIAWGLTNVMADYIDLYRERVNPDNPNQYLYKGKWEEFRVVTGEIKIKGRKRAKPFSYRMTRHGSVIENGSVGNYKIRKWARDEVMAMKLIDVDMGTFFGGYVDLAKAQDWDQFREACGRAALGPVAWNHAFADADGNIGYQTVAHIPVRADNQGVTINEGWTGAGDWTGYVPFEEMPHMFNPPKGYLLSANNRIEPDGYPYYISSSYFPYRAMRINEYLAAKPKATAADMMELHADTVDIPAKEIMPYVIEDLAKSGKIKYVVIANILKKWLDDGCRDDIDEIGPSINYAFIKYFPADVLADEMGGELAENEAFMCMGFIHEIMDDPENEWFDDIKTSRRETRRDITMRSMKKAVKYISHILGKDIAGWQWGKLHQIKLGHAMALFPKPILRGGEPLARGPYPHPGGDETINLGYALSFKNAGYRVIVGPSSRMIVDFAHPNWIYTAASTGMSSNPLEPHYDNLTEKWRNVEYVRMYLDEDNFSKNAKGTVLLKP